MHVIPPVGLGTYELAGSLCERVVFEALARGYRHIDTAQGYGNEDAIGAALSASGLTPEAVFLTTKVWPDHLVADLEGTLCASLEALGVPRVDLLLLHWPSPQLSVEATVDALAEARERGWARHVGVSNFPLESLRTAQQRATIACNQVELHPLLGQARLQSGAEALGVPLVAYSPLARGRALTDPTVQAIAERRRHTPAQIVLAWLLQRDIAVIPKTSRPERLAENLAATEIRLSVEEMAAMAALDEGTRLFDPPFAPSWDR